MAVAGGVEDSFENELGLDHDETRSWHGWHRHVSLVMLAYAMLAAIRHRANTASPPQKHPEDCEHAVSLIRWSVQEIRRSATGPRQIRSAPVMLGFVDKA